MPGNPPAEPKLFYITHIENLASIANSGSLYSDAQRHTMELIATNIGMSDVKERRLNRCQVRCHQGTTVGQFVPFYFCPRSVMLYIIYARNNADLAYRGGQEPIVHLQIDMHTAIHWAEQNKRHWAFSDRNAASGLASFYKDLRYLDQLDWDAINADRWNQGNFKEGKQAEFLIYNSIAWNLVEKIGVINHVWATQVAAILAGLDHNPPTAIEPTWYY